MKGLINMLKSEKGMTKLELVITIVSIMFILACSIVLVIGENGLSFLPKGNTVNNAVDETNTVNEANEVNEPNDVIPAENKITNEIENIINETI